MWPVTFNEAQPDEPEQEKTLTMFRFRRPKAFESKDYIERQQKRYQAEIGRFTAKAADALATLGAEAIDEAEKDARYDASIIALARDQSREKLSDEAFTEKLEALFSVAAERKKWWLGWKEGSLTHEEGRALDFADENDVRYLFDSEPKLEAAIDAAIAEIHRGARQKNLKP